MRLKDFIQHLSAKYKLDDDLDENYHGIYEKSPHRQRVIDSSIEFLNAVPNLIKEEEFKTDFIANKENILNHFVLQPGIEKTHPALKVVFELFFRDPDLKRAFLVGHLETSYFTLRLMASLRPDLIDALLHDEEIIEASKQSSFHVIRDILCRSKDIRHADLVFNNPQIYGNYDNEEFKQFVYYCIETNYKESLNALVKNSVFSVQNLPSERGSAAPGCEQTENQGETSTMPATINYQP